MILKLKNSDSILLQFLQVQYPSLQNVIAPNIFDLLIQAGYDSSTLSYSPGGLQNVVAPISVIFIFKLNIIAEPSLTHLVVVYLNVLSTSSTNGIFQWQRCK